MMCKQSEEGHCQVLTKVYLPQNVKEFACIKCFSGCGDGTSKSHGGHFMASRTGVHNMAPIRARWGPEPEGCCCRRGQVSGSGNRKQSGRDPKRSGRSVKGRWRRSWWCFWPQQVESGGGGLHLYGLRHSRLTITKHNSSFSDWEETDLLTRRIRWPTVISWFPSGWGWAALCGPPSTRFHLRIVRGTGVSYTGILAASREHRCPHLRSRRRPWCHPWTRPRRTWPVSACWWRVWAVCPLAGARRRGSLSPDCPPARPCLIDDGQDGEEEAAEGGRRRRALDG